MCKDWQLLQTVWTVQALTVTVNSVNCASTDSYCEQFELWKRRKLLWTVWTVQALTVTVKSLNVATKDPNYNQCEMCKHWQLL
jgi:hypothetical protein